MIHNIYIITNTINNKVYVGQTSYSINDRFYFHKQAKKGCIKLVRAFDKHGRDNFSIDLLVSCEDQMTADYLEKFWIKVYDSISNGYNIRDGGNSSKMSEESRKKMSLAKLGKKRKPHTEESKKKMSRNNYGRTYTGKTWKVINGKRVWIL